MENATVTYYITDFNVGANGFHFKYRCFPSETIRKNEKSPFRDFYS